jgi:hypothetical protein
MKEIDTNRFKLLTHQYEGCQACSFFSHSKDDCGDENYRSFCNKYLQSYKKSGISIFGYHWIKRFSIKDILKEL